MKIYIIINILLLNSYLFSENLEYKHSNDNDENSNYYVLEYPKDCKKIIEIKESVDFEFKEKKGINKIFSQCSIYVKGKSVKEGVKAGSGAIVKTGVKVKEGVKKGTGKLAESVVKETDYIIDDTIKLKNSIVKGTGNILGATISKGVQVKDGVSSFFKGILSSSD